MKYTSYLSNLFKGSVLSLILLVFLQASSASASTLIGDQTQLEAIGENLGGDYVVTDSFVVGPPTGERSTYVVGYFTGTFSGGGFIISGLTKPLFDAISDGTSAEVSDLTLIADQDGVSGRGMLSNDANNGTVIENVHGIGDVNGGASNSVGGLVGTLGIGQMSGSSFIGDVTGRDNVGGLVGVSFGEISDSSYSGNVLGEISVGGLVGDSNQHITNSSAQGTVSGHFYVGGLVGNSTSIISGSFAEGTVLNINDFTGGLVGYSTGNISNSYATGNVGGAYDVGGLVGFSEGDISNSYATGAVDGTDDVGGLVGESAGDITNSYATGEVEGDDNVGGLVGDLAGTITNSYATGEVEGDDNVGGLVGDLAGTITNSYATGSVIGLEATVGGDVGGLVGISNGTITNSYATGDVAGYYDVGGLVGDLQSEGIITNAYATGNVSAAGSDGDWANGWGGLVGESSGSIINSYATGSVLADYNYGSLIGFLRDDSPEEPIRNSFATGSTIPGSNQVTLYDYDGAPIGLTGLGGFIGCRESESFNCGEETEQAGTSSILSVVNTPSNDFDPAFAFNASINRGLPYLISLIDSYDVAETPSLNSLRPYYTQAARSLDKALISFGFKSNLSSHPNLGFQALEQNQSKLPSVIQLFEVAEYQNSNILLNKQDGLQLSISSYYKEAVEIWTQGSNGEYLYLGLVEFDKDGKAILPALKFDTANTYQLLMIKAADKLSQNPNLDAQLGQITIYVF